VKVGDIRRSRDWCQACFDTTDHEHKLLSVEPLHDALKKHSIELYGKPTHNVRTWARRCVQCKRRR
jgi:hypothetical protein